MGSRPKNNNFVTILAYHEICDLPMGISRHHPYNVSPKAFSEQMDYLYTNGYSVISLEKYLCPTYKKNKEIKDKSLILTFDDGYRNNHTNAYPILKYYNYPATIFLATDYIGSSKPFPWLDNLFEGDIKIKENWLPLSWKEAAKMSQDGIIFGSHTCAHSNIRQMEKNEIKSEIVKSKNTIEEKLNKNVTLFSYPFSLPKHRNCYSHLINSTKNLLKGNGFVGACTTIIGRNYRDCDPFCLKRIQIRNTDSLFQFKAKVEGAYNWAGFAQKMYQKFLEPMFEMINHRKLTII